LREQVKEDIFGNCLREIPKTKGGRKVGLWFEKDHGWKGHVGDGEGKGKKPGRKKKKTYSTTHEEEKILA